METKILWKRWFKSWTDRYTSWLSKKSENINKNQNLFIKYVKPLLQIENRKIGLDHTPLIIAEIGINHGGSQMLKNG